MLNKIRGAYSARGKGMSGGFWSDYHLTFGPSLWAIVLTSIWFISGRLGIYWIAQNPAWAALIEPGVGDLVASGIGFAVVAVLLLIKHLATWASRIQTATATEAANVYEPQIKALKEQVKELEAKLKKR